MDLLEASPAGLSPGLELSNSPDWKLSERVRGVRLSSPAEPKSNAGAEIGSELRM